MLKSRYITKKNTLKKNFGMIDLKKQMDFLIGMPTGRKLNLCFTNMFHVRRMNKQRF